CTGQVRTLRGLCANTCTAASIRSMFATNVFRGTHMFATDLRATARLFKLGHAALLLATAGVGARPLAAQVPEAQVAQAYIDTHAEFEDMVYVPMRDGVRLYHLIIFPK